MKYVQSIEMEKNRMLCKLVLMLMVWMQYAVGYLSTQPQYLFYTGIIGLQNCSYVHIVQNAKITAQRWQITEFQQVFSQMGTKPYPYSQKRNFINTTRPFFIIGAWSNKIDQFIYTANDIKKVKFTQMVNLITNTSYKWTHGQFNFAVYLNNEQSLIIDSVYPYRIFNGSLKQQNHIEVYAYPPTLLQPLNKMVCNKYLNCLWLMNQGIFLAYPMLSTPYFMKFMDERIVSFTTTCLNQTCFVYTGTDKGIVYEWVETGLGKYQPKRMFSAFHSLPIRDLIIIENTLMIQSMDGYRQTIYLPSSRTYDKMYFFGANSSIACENNADYDPMIKGYKWTAYDYNTWRGTIGLYKQQPNYAEQDMYPFRIVSCQDHISQLEHTAGQYGQLHSHQCIVDTNAILADGGYQLQAPVQGCIGYTKRKDPVCLECSSGYQLLFLNGTSKDREFQLTTCKILINTTNSSANNVSNATTTNGTLNITDSTLNITDSTINASNSTNITNSTDPLDNTNINAVNSGHQTVSPESPTAPSSGLPKIAYSIIQIITIVIEKSTSPFYYLKNIMQVTLFAFTIHGLLNLWVLGSLYYFLPMGSQFLKNILLTMWKIYNTSALALFNIQQPQLPRLNQQQSDLNYGQITISNDFLQFTFDPFTMFVVALVNYVVFYYLRKFIRFVLKRKSEYKLTWLKFDMFQSISDIVIQLLPVLFLPCANFVFNPHFRDYLERVNLLLFSAMSGFGLIFPFFYFSKIVKDKNKQQVSQNKNQTKNDKKNQKGNKFTIIKQAKLFLKSKSKQLDEFIGCILNLTVPVTVTIADAYFFFVSNGLIILYGLINSLLLKKNKLGPFFFWLYFFLYHCCFFLMNYYKDTEMQAYCSFAAMIIIVVSLIHQIMKLLYRIVKFFRNCCKEGNKNNKVMNANDALVTQIAKQNRIIKTKNLTKSKIQNKIKIKSKINSKKDKVNGYQQMAIQEYSRKQQSMNIISKLFEFSQSSASNTRYSKQSVQTSSHFFKQQDPNNYSQIMPLASAISAAVASRRMKRKSKLRKQRLDKKFDVVRVDVAQKYTESILDIISSSAQLRSSKNQ